MPTDCIGDDSSSSIITKVQLEIDRLHGFFVEWFTGSIDNTNENFALVDESLAENFHLVNPQGVTTARGALLQALQSSYNSRRGQVYNIECRNVQLLQKHLGMYLVSYEEWQQIEETETARVVSAWLCDDKEREDCLQWVHVHETWMPGKAPTAPSQMWSANEKDTK